MVNQDNVYSKVSGSPSKTASCKGAPVRLSRDIKMQRLLILHCSG